MYCIGKAQLLCIPLGRVADASDPYLPVYFMFRMPNTSYYGRVFRFQ